MKLEERETAMGQSEEEHGHAEMPPVPQQRQEPPVETRQRTDRQDDVQKCQREGAEGANEQRLGGDLGAHPEADADEEREVERRSPHTTVS